MQSYSCFDDKALAHRYMCKHDILFVQSLFATSIVTCSISLIFSTVVIFCIKIFCFVDRAVVTELLHGRENSAQ